MKSWQKFKAYFEVILDKRWFNYTMLALPFLIVVVYTSGLTEQFKTFHYQDESLHYLVAVEFYDQFAATPFGDYLSSVTPMYYIVLNALGRLTENSMVSMRWLTMCCSYCAIVLFYILMTRRIDPPGFALLPTIVFGLSPYIFGSSFILLNDNLALLFLVAAVVVGERNDNNSLLIASLSYGLAGLAVLTRQNYIWVYAMLLVIELSYSRLSKNRWEKLLVASISLAPTLGFFVLWGGITPPSHQSHHVAQGLNWKAILLIIALIGFYSTFIFRWRSHLQNFRELLVSTRRFVLVVACAILVVASIATLGLSKAQYGTDGFFLSMLRPTWYLGNASIFIYVFAVFGILVLEMIAKKRGSNYLIAIGAFAATMLPSIMMFQKYYDYMLLIWILYAVRERSEISVAGSFLLLMGFAVYHIAYQIKF